MASTYNGWQTYETWLCNIHFDCWDFSEYTEQIADTEPEDEADVRNWLEDYIRESVKTSPMTHWAFPLGNGFTPPPLRNRFQDLLITILGEDFWEASLLINSVQKESTSQQTQREGD